ncbi:hypothetical protein ABH930_002171 [Kitasatospora sp. GAS204A]|uniref:hypothetical protein n=1 Tax=unclassified Kitasatospora TaxID=2633591 RepID=UPI002473C874|nr:hypothetical protein [Kitasatospora sp. GAS204B]MDH6115966.1 hypothetical protein [Kitasatospora sp. GAS204B]
MIALGGQSVTLSMMAGSIRMQVGQAKCENIQIEREFAFLESGLGGGIRPCGAGRLIT